VDDSGTIVIPGDQCQACGICVAECPANAIVLRKPRDRRHIDEELDHILRSVPQSPVEPLIVGFGCQYGLFGTGTLSGLSKRAQAGIWIVPVLCVATVEPQHIMRAFEMGAEGVFVAGCGEQCARENTAFWLTQRMAKVRKALLQLGLESERVQSFNLRASEDDPVASLDKFTKKIGELRLALALQQEVVS
jgi:coenzyme F420-reducing hydrogenase delta subunit